MKGTSIFPVKFRLLAVGILLSVGLLVPHAPVVSAQAAADSTITLSPSLQSYKAEAGSRVVDKLKVLNNGSEAYDFIVYGRPYSVKGDTYEPVYETVENVSNNDAYKWLRFEKTSWRLEPGKEIEIPYTLNVPEGAAPGGHYGVIFVETKAPQNGGEAVIRNKRLGAVLLVTVKGTYEMGGQLKNSSISPLQFRSPLTTTTKVENTGNADFATKLTLTVADMFGGVKYRATKDFTIFPDTTRSMPMEWTNSPWFGLYKVSVASEFLDKKQTDESYVLIIPRWMLVVLALALVVGVVYAIRRRR